MVLIDAIVHYEHVQVISFEIGQESVEICTDVENKRISGKKQRDNLTPHF
jgi:hypothetical protein